MSDAYTDDQQKEHRDAFVRECRQKAWGARCHADWVAKGLDQIVAEYEKLQAEDRDLGEQIKTLDTAVDSHTKDNRLKRKELQERRNAIAKATKALAANMQEGQRALQGLLQSVEASLQLATHAEGWEWKEAETTVSESAPVDSVK